MKKIAIGLLLVGAAAAAAWFGFIRVPELAVVKPTRGPAVEAVYATGAVEPQYWAKVATTQLGRIAAIPVKEGDKVKAGDVLMKLDDREARAKLAEAEELERVSKLAETNIASRQQYQRVAAQHAAAVATTAAARQRLSEMTLTSPLDGEVLRLDGNVGEVVRAGDAVAWVGHCCPMRIEAEVDEEDIPRVQRGQEVLVRADAFAGRSFKAKVTAITPKGDPVSKIYRVRITLESEQPLQIGMTVEVNIILRRRDNALLVPFTAVRDGHVFVAENGRAARRPVKAGIVGATRVEILEGLKDSDAIVAEPPPNLADGDRIRAKAAPAAAGKKTG
jgi:RND family efflux transporter MFP subunit